MDTSAQFGRGKSYFLFHLVCTQHTLRFLYQSTQFAIPSAAPISLFNVAPVTTKLLCGQGDAAVLSGASYFWIHDPFCTDYLETAHMMTLNRLLSL
jgi:hypothetical protein